jgi:hypothetical protein
MVGLKTEAIGADSFRLTELPEKWKATACRGDGRRTHFVKDGGHMMLTTFVLRLGSPHNSTNFETSCENCFAGRHHVVELPRKRSRANGGYWLFGHVAGLMLGSSDLDEAWADQDASTREWYAETCREIKTRQESRVSVFVPEQFAPYIKAWRASEETRLSKIKDMFDSDVALGKIHKKTSYVDYVNDILCNEAYN